MFQIFKKMPHGNPGFDYICGKGYRLQVKARCLSDNYWNFTIFHNNTADKNMNLLHLWLIHKDDIIRGYSFWKREGFTITNTPEKLEELKEYEIIDGLDTAIECCNTLKRIK